MAARGLNPLSMVKTRFAPSPTGYLHVGGARTALFNWLYARANGGHFVLRVEDTDAARNTEEAREAIFGGLEWLGIDWDEGPFYQSQRQEIYDRYWKILEDGGYIYPDPESGALRFKSPKETLTFEDKVCGEITVDRSAEPDMTLRRPDGSYIFHFVNVVDDIEMGITHVIRGEDHLMNTPKHLEIYKALGATPPVFAHIPLILNEDGSKMSKRDQGAAVGSYPADGFLPEAVMNYLCLLGWNPKDDREKLSLEEILALFDWDHLNSSNAKFGLEKCQWLNGQYLAELTPEQFAEAALPFAPEGTPPALLPLVQQKVRLLSEVKEWLRPILEDDFPTDPEAAGKVTSNPDTSANLEAVATALSGIGEWTQDSIKDAVATTATALGTKPGKLMFPLRVASTGVAQGTDLLATLELLGQERTVARIRNRITSIFA